MHIWGAITGETPCPNENAKPQINKHGSPVDREPSLVLQDVLNGYVSLRSAEDDYGVVINALEMKVDTQGTQKLRDQKKASQGG